MPKHVVTCIVLSTAHVYVVSVGLA